MSKRINLGCGNKSISGYIGVDRIKTAAADIVHDLNIFPYPFDDNSIEEIIMDNAMEHLDDIVAVMKEIHRICRAGAIIKLSAPYYKSSGAFTDITHKHFFTEKSFDIFNNKHEYFYYSGFRFKVIQVKLMSKGYNDKRHILRNFLPFKKILNNFLFNIYDEIYFELKCIK